MKRTKLQVLSLVAMCTAATSRAQIADDIPTDARSLAMGESGTATAVGAAAVWWNPAALAVSDGLDFLVSGRQLVPDLADDVWIGSSAVSFGTSGMGFGAQYTYLSYGATNVTDLQGGNQRTVRPFEYVFRLAAGIDVLRFAPDVSENLTLGIGATLNVSHADLAPFSVLVSTGQDVGTAWHGDLAILLRARMPVEVVSEDDYLGWRFGVLWENVSGQELEVGTQFGPQLSQSMNLGLALEGGLRETQLWQHLLHGVFTFDAQFFTGEQSDQNPIYKCGFEFSPGVQRETHTFFVAARAGYLKDDDGDVSNATIGGALGTTIHASARDYSFNLEYANLPQASGLERVHHGTLAVSVTY